MEQRAAWLLPGDPVTRHTRGVVGSFFAADSTCEIRQVGYQSSCIHRQPVGGAQAQ